MKHMRRFALILALGVGLALSGAAQADEHEGGQHTTAVAVNTKDGKTVFKLSFHVINNPRDVVDNINAAVAISSCEGCTTIAASFQVVLVTGDPTVVSPENYAIALNVECTDCQTLASAYQFVKSTGGTLTFTPEGRQALADIRKALQDLRKNAEGMTIFEIQAQLDALAEQLAQVLANELTALDPDLGLDVDDGEGDDASSEEGDDDGEDEDEPSSDVGTTSPEPTPAESPTAAETSSPSPSPTTTG